MNSSKRKVIAPLICWAVLLCASCFTLPSHAEAEEYQECLNAHSDNMGWGTCGREEIERLNAMLSNAFSKAAMLSQAADTLVRSHKGYRIPMHRTLVAEQNAWSQYLQAACEYYGNPTWGQVQDVLTYPTCKANVIRQRIHELDNLIERLTPH